MMLKSTLHTTTVYLVLVIFLMSSGGFSVYQHTCACDNSSHASLVAESLAEDLCGDDSGTDACCSLASEQVRAGMCQENKDCCSIVSFFVKIDDLYVQSFSDPVKTEPGVLEALENGIDPESILSQTDIDHVGHHERAVSSNLAGKTLLIRLSQLKIPAPEIA